MPPFLTATMAISEYWRGEDRVPALMQNLKDLGPIINICGHNAMQVHSRMKFWPKDETCIGFHLNTLQKFRASLYGRFPADRIVREETSHYGEKPITRCPLRHACTSLRHQHDLRY